LKNLKSIILFSILLLIPLGIQNSYAGAGGSLPVLGEIRWFAGNFAPRNTALCDGQLLAVNQNQALFSLLGTTYGGDGETTFGLPDMRGRMPLDDGSGPGLTPRSLGQKGGEETETLTSNQIASHTHTLMASSELGVSTDPQGNVLHTGQHPFLHRVYRGSGTLTDMGSASIANTGGGQSHPNIPPFLNINCLINLAGIFPNGGGSGFIGEIRWGAYNFAPSGWAMCDGQLLPISSNTALFSILGTTYGGDGETTFGLPDMRGRMPMHDNDSIGQKVGLESVTLSVNEIPSHTHQLRASNANGDTKFPQGNLLATGTHPYAHRIYQSNTLDINMGSQAIMNTGGQAHNNMPPFLTLNCIIALSGDFPPPTGNGSPVGEPFIGEIKWFGGNYAPVGYEKCDGQLLPIVEENFPLFSILGTIYGGDGRTNFALPNLDERIPMHPGNGPGLTQRRLGETGGTPTVTLNVAQMASHTHTLKAFSEFGNSIDPNGNLLASGLHPNYHKIYALGGTPINMHGSALYDTGGNQPHQNLPPHLKITCLIALTGTFPSQD